MSGTRTEIVQTFGPLIHPRPQRRNFLNLQPISGQKFAKQTPEFSLRKTPTDTFRHCSLPERRLKSRNAPSYPGTGPEKVQEFFSGVA